MIPFGRPITKRSTKKTIFRNLTKLETLQNMIKNKISHG